MTKYTFKWIAAALWIILLIPSFSLFSQEYKIGNLSFFVSDAENGYGVKAEILLSSENDSFHLKTASTGHLFFNGEAGKYNVIITSPRYAALNTYFVIENGRSLNINVILDRQHKTLAEYTKYESPIVEGYVVDCETGRPLAGVAIEIAPEKLLIKTNEQGFFSLSPMQFSSVRKPTDKAVRGTLSISMKGFSTQTIENLLLVPDKIKLNIALEKGEGNNTQKYIQHVLDGTKQDAELYEKSIPKGNSPVIKKEEPRSINGCLIPSSIRVGTGCTCTSCTNVSVMSLQAYSESGIDNEWISSWQFESLAAGSVAYRTYGGWYVNNPVDVNYDIASTTCNQVWDGTIYTNAQSAAQATAGEIVTDDGINPARSEYSAENNKGGSSLNCADCNAGGSGLYSCYSDNMCCGQAPSGHGRGMCQWGTQYWAQNGQNNQWMINHYYIATIGYSICGSNIDNIAPTTQVTAPVNWVTQNFTASFTDIDNAGGSGIEKSFYQVLEYNGIEWRANNGNGFFSDNFDNAIHPDWTIGTGAWAINGGFLEQSDEINTNTNIYAPLTQNLSNRYLYNWQGKIAGTGTNRRAGFHFFCDSASQTNRGNSYFVWFMADQSQLDIFKTAGNNFGSASYSVPLTINVNTWYDFTVLFDRISGKMDVYVNNVLAGSWTDPAPYSNGNYISFRSGESNFMVNNLKIYRSRPQSVIVSIGGASSNDVRFQNPNPATPSCRVKSITKDAAGNLSAVASQDVNIDWTIPAALSINDGTSADIDTAYSLTQLSANWTASADTNSGIAKYWYAIGTTPGAIDAANWTSNNLSLAVTRAGLALSPNQYYYFSVKSEDGAGLQSAVFSSNGQYVSALASGIDEFGISEGISVFPNPFTNTTIIRYQSGSNLKSEITLTDLIGKEIVLYSGIQLPGSYELTINTVDLKLSKGMYFVRLKSAGISRAVKIIVD